MRVTLSLFPLVLCATVSPLFASGGMGGMQLMSFLPLILVFVVMYFLMIRPQQKKDQQHKETLAKLKKGDCVVTQSGMIGVIHSISTDDELLVEFTEGLPVRLLKRFVTAVLERKDIPRPRLQAAAVEKTPRKVAVKKTSDKK